MNQPLTRSSQFIYLLVGVGLAVILSACTMSVSPLPTAALLPDMSTPTATPLPTTAPTATPAYPWTDENITASGICFEAARDAAGRVFVLRRAEEHIRFYDEVDSRRLCRQPVTRQPFTFDGGRVLAGLWSAGMGCTARHEVLSVQRDDTARTFTIQLRFVTDGDCAYELVRPFWVGLDGLGEYNIQFVVTQ